MFLSAAAAFAASVIVTDVSAKAVADLPSPEDIAEEMRVEAEIAERRAINNAAATNMCDQLNILSGVESVMAADLPVNGGTTLYPKAFHFAEGAVTFPPYDPATQNSPEVIIRWPDIVELDEFGEEIMMEGKEQIIVLEDQSLTETRFFAKGFEAEAITEDISNKLQCFANAVEENGVMNRSVSCADHLGQMSVVEFSGQQASLSYSFDIMTTPTTPLRLGCMWGVDLKNIETAPNGP